MNIYVYKIICRIKRRYDLKSNAVRNKEMKAILIYCSCASRDATYAAISPRWTVK